MGGCYPAKGSRIPAVVGVGLPGGTTVSGLDFPLRRGGGHAEHLVVRQSAVTHEAGLFLEERRRNGSGNQCRTVLHNRGQERKHCQGRQTHLHASSTL